jgi:hypothetical protein
MRRIPELICILVFLLTGAKGYGQGGCLSPNTNLFVLDLHFPESWHMKKDLIITLVNEDSIPYLNPQFVQDDRMITKGPQEFLRNTPSSMKAKHPGQVWQYWPAIPEDMYTIQIPAKKQQIYLARIIARHDKQTDTLFYHLPIARSFNICATGLDTLDDSSDLARYADNIAIIAIELGVPQEPPTVSAYPEKFLFKYDLDTGSIGFNGALLVSLDRIRVYDAATLALVQVIPTPDARPCFSTEIQKIIQPIKLDPSRGYPDIPDLKLLVEEQYDAATKRKRERFQFFVYDTLSKRFTLDSLLSTKWDVGLDPQNNIVAYEILKEGNKQHIDKQQYFAGKGWVFISRTTSYDVPQGGNDIPVSNCMGANIATTYMAPIRIRTSRWESEAYIDSMPIYNPCYEKIGVIAETNARDWTITCPRFLVPQDTTWIKILSNCNGGGDLWKCETTFKLIFQDQSSKLVTFRYFNAWDSTLMAETSNPGLTAYIEQAYPAVLSPPITVHMLEVYPNGKPSGYGEVIYSDHQKVGTWEIWDSSGRVMPTERYGKEFRVSIMNPTHLSDNLRLFAYQDGKRTELRCIKHYSDFVTWLPEGMDSLRAESGKAHFEGVIEQKVLNNEQALYLYLIYPNEPFIRQGYNKIPITWDPDTYVLLWDYADPAYAAAGNNAGKILSDRLKTRFPDLMLFIAPDGTDAFFPTIMITNQSPARRTQILNFLINDPLVDVVSRKVQYGDDMQTFHFNTITVGINVNQNNQFARDLADRYGAHINSIYGTGNLYEFRFSNLVIDESWAKTLEALFHEKGVELVSPSVYTAVTLDGE